MRLLIIPMLCLTLSGCVVLDWIVGKSPEKITKEIDTNGDGLVTEEEIKNSKYDLDKNGILTAEEMQKAMAPHAGTDAITNLLVGFGVPGAGILATTVAAARRRKKNIYSLVAGVEEVAKKAKGGLTKKEVFEIMSTAKEAFGDVKSLTKEVKKIKADLGK